MLRYLYSTFCTYTMKCFKETEGLGRLALDRGRDILKVKHETFNMFKLSGLFVTPFGVPLINSPSHM